MQRALGRVYQSMEVLTDSADPTKWSYFIWNKSKSINMQVYDKSP